LNQCLFLLNKKARLQSLDNQSSLLALFLRRRDALFSH
jgi:hypothetical protein